MYNPSNVSHRNVISETRFTFRSENELYIEKGNAGLNVCIRSLTHSVAFEGGLERLFRGSLRKEACSTAELGTLSWSGLEVFPKY